jgi:hypothetical protein
MCPGVQVKDHTESDVANLALTGVLQSRNTFQLKWRVTAEKHLGRIL